MKCIKLFISGLLGSACFLGANAKTQQFFHTHVNGVLRTMPIIQVGVFPDKLGRVFQDFSLGNQSQDISSKMSPVKDQGDLGTCATFSSVALIERYTHKRLSEECLLRYRGDYDGSLTKEVLKDVKKYGLVEEKQYDFYNCVYDDHKRKNDISEEEYQQFADEQGHYGRGMHIVHKNDTQLDDDYFPPHLILGDKGKSFPYIKAQLDKGNPVVIGVTVPQSPDASKAFQGGNGRHVIDLTDEDNCSGHPLHQGDSFFEVGCPGHAIILTGYDDKKQIFLFKNSWGTKWGYKGYGKLSYDYVANYRVSVTSTVE